MEQKTNPENKAPAWILAVILLCVPLGIFLWQKNNNNTVIQSSSEQQALNEQILSKWGKSFSELPTENLIVVSPHNETIREEFEHAFVRYCAVEKGKRVLIWWRQVGGSNAILDFLMGQQQKPLALDVVFGGGEYLFQKLADEDMLVPLTLNDQVLEQIPSECAGIHLRDPQLRWCGNVLSGFGFLYNKEITQSLGVDSLNTWQDLTQPQLFGQIAVADPKNSGSTVVAFEMILQSEKDWQSGWKKLFGILSNAKEFATSSDHAANAPLFDQAAAAICIDFYGISRQAIEPGKLAYISPQGGTAFTPDPIAILKDAPNSQLAQEFVNFVLSPQGQALWRCKPSENAVMAVNALYRIPIRKDFYTNPSENIPDCVMNPYEMAQTVHIDSELRLLRFNVLRQLVRAAAVDNFEGMVNAKQKLIDSADHKAMEDAFFKLPDNVDTVEEIRSLAEQMNDPEKAGQITSEWTEFFKKKYEKIAG